MIELGECRSAIRDLFEYGLRRKAEVGTENVYDFSLGNPSIPAPEKVNRTLIQLLEQTESTALHGYSSAAGDPEVRKAVAESINARFGTKETSGDIYMTCGAAASLTISLHALLDEGDEVITVAPYFPEYKVFIEKANGIMHSVPAREGDFAPNLEKLEQALNDKTRAVILNSPNNPAGTVISEENLRAITALLQKASKKQGRPIWIIADEPYRELVYENVQVPYLMNLYRNTLVCYSYSKALSLPGERIGYIALCHEAENREKTFAAICGAGRALGYVCAPVLFQKMLLSCLNETSDISAYKENRDLLYNALCSLGFTCVKPDGAFYLFVKAPGGNDRDFCEEAKKLDLLIVPSESFGMPGYARIAYCVSKDTIERSLPAFGKLAEHYGLK